MKIIKLSVGDVLQTKKQHPCGGDSFDVLRCGSDIRIKCRKCGCDITMPRVRLEKSIKTINGEKPV